MKNSLLAYFTLFFASYSFGQNIGIGTPTPSEKLDINGNVNVQGQIKVAGQQGTTGQVLTKDASNNPIWASMSNEFDTIAVIDNPLVGTTHGVNWTVPAGTTKIFVELWAGGGGGGYLFSGAAGGYVSGFIATVPESSLPIAIGAGGNTASGSEAAAPGGNTSIVYNGQTFTAYGGAGSFGGTTNTPNVPSGGSFLSSSPTAFGLKGADANGTMYNYGVASPTTYFQEIRFGKGADAPLYPGSGPKGGYSFVILPANTIVTQYYGQVKGTYPGFGGSSDITYGYSGGNGRVIIHWKK